MATASSMRQLENALRRLQDRLPNVDVMPRELLDGLWIANRIAGTPARAERDVGGEEAQAEVKSSDYRATPAQPVIPDQTEERQPGSRLNRSRLAGSGRATSETGAYTTAQDARPSEDSTLPGMPLRVPGSPALPHTLRIARALRPLMKRVASRTEEVLDDMATSELSAELNFFHPVMRPATSRWLDLALVVERAGSMRFWARSIEDLRHVLERHSAFRNMRAWNLVETSPEKLTLQPWGTGVRTAETREIIDPAGRQLIVVVSDCVSQAWNNGTMSAAIAEWAAHGPVSLLQVLPQDLWHRTALRYSSRALLHATSPAAASSALIVATEGITETEQAIRLPITTLEPASLSAWAGAVAATSGAAVPGVLLPATISEKKRADRAQRAEKARLITAEERVQRFDQTATADAQRMARLFAAAYFPLTPPVMRLIHATVMPSAPASSIAEVLLGGMLERRKDSSTDPDETRYDFVSEEVRHRLLDGASATDMLRVLRTNVSAYIRQRQGDVIDFSAFLKGPDASSSLTISKKQEPFARIAIAILRRLGGTYADLADRLAQRIEDGAVGAVPAAGSVLDVALLRSWSKPGHPRRPRVELAAYLGIPEAMRAVGTDVSTSAELREFMRGLARWGLPVTIEAAIVLAETAMRRSGRLPATERDELGALAHRMVREQSEAAIAAVDRKLGPWFRPSTHDNALLIAAYVAALPFRRTELVFERTMGLVESLVRNAQSVEKSQELLREAVTHALISEIMTEGDCLVPDYLPFRASVLVAGSGSFELPQSVQSAAKNVGRMLARSGFGLICGGWRGVDHLCARAYAAEMEILGQPVTDDLVGGALGGKRPRLVQIVETYAPDFPHGIVRRTKDWIESALEHADAVITLGGHGFVPVIIEAADRKRIPVFALPWTGGASAKYGFRRDPGIRRPGAFDVEATASPGDDLLLAQRVASAIAVVTDRKLARQWNYYTDLLHALLSHETPAAIDRRAPSFGGLRRALIGERSPRMFDSKQTLVELTEAAGKFPEWLAYDYASLAVVEREAFDHREQIIATLAALAREVAAEQTRIALESRLRHAAAPLPGSPFSLLPQIAREFFGSYEELDGWTKAVAGLEADECFFRASIDFEAFRAAQRYIDSETPDAERHVEQQIRPALASLAPRREYVRRFADTASHPARVIGYVFMHLFDLGIGPVELVGRIHDEIDVSTQQHQTKPLKQLLLAAARIAAAFNASGLRMLARTLRDGRQLIDDTTIQDVVDYALETQLRAADAQNREIDAFAEKSARGGFRAVLTRIPRLLANFEFTAAELEFLFRSGGATHRELALRLAAMAKGRTPFEAVREALMNPRRPAELLLAIDAARAISRELTHAQLSALIEATAARRLTVEDRGTGGRLDSLAEELKARRDVVDRVRFAPIAIIGSDFSGGALAEFCRDLGERLAMVQLGVITANPVFGSWLADGYRRRSPNLETFVIVRRTSDARPQREGVTYRNVDRAVSGFREELLNPAKGVICIGGGGGAFREYELAGKRGLPIVAIPSTGGAAAQVAEACLERLRDAGAEMSLLETVRLGTPNIRVASAVAHAMSSVVIAREVNESAAVQERQVAAEWPLDQLVAAVELRVERWPSALDCMKAIAVSVGTGRLRWQHSHATLQRFEKVAQQFAARHADDALVAELASRCVYAACVIELSYAVRAGQTDDQDTLSKALQYDRVATAPLSVLQALLAGMNSARVPLLAGRLREQIGFKIACL